MKKNLTSGQKSLIKDLENNFSNLNVVVVGKFSLIDCGAILDDIDHQKQWNKQMRLANDTFAKMKHSAMVEDIKLIKTDLLAYGIKIQVHTSSFELYFGEFDYDSNRDSSYYYNRFKIGYYNTHYRDYKYSHNGNTDGYKVDSVYTVHIMEDTTMYHCPPPMTLVELVKGKEFQRKLKWLLQSKLDNKS